MRRNIQRSELIRGGQIFISLFMIVSFLFVTTADVAGYDYNDYQQASNTIGNLTSEIRGSEGIVSQALMEAMAGKYGEIQKWQDIDAKMNTLGQTLDRNLPEIGKNIDILLAVNPNSNLPIVALGQTFDGNLKMVRDKQDELNKLAIIESDKLKKVNQKLAQVDELMLKASASYATQTALDLSPLPDDFWEFGADSTVAVLALYSGPVGWIALVSVAVIGGISKVNKAYVNSKTLADRMKAYTQMKDLLLEKKKLHGDNYKKLSDAAKEMHEIELILQKHSKKMDEYKEKVNTAVEGWNGQTEAAFEKKKKELEEEAKKLAATPKPTINLNAGYIVGMNPVPPLQTGEYAEEVDSMIAQMESLTKSVEDGGDPDKFQSMVVDWANRKNEQYVKASENYKQNYDAYVKADEARWRQLGPIYNECMIATNAIPLPLDNRSVSWSAYEAARWAIWARYDVASKAAYVALEPYGRALITPFRELSRIREIHQRVRAAYPLFYYRINNATQAATKEFRNEFGLWQTKYNDVNIKANQIASAVPYGLSGWKNQAGSLDAYVDGALNSGQDIYNVRSGLLDTANQLQELDKTVREATKAYQEANPERIRISNQAQSELKSLIAKYGRLINYPAMYFFMPQLERKAYFTPHSPQQDIYIEKLEEDVKNAFTVTEPGNIVEAKTVDLIAIAKIYEDKAQGLSFYTDWIEQYRDKLSAAVSRLDKISLKQTGGGFYADHEGTPLDALNKEFSEAPFGSIMKEAAGLVNVEESGRYTWEWEAMNPWEKLNSAQSVLYNRVADELNENVISPNLAKWVNLRALFVKYDAAAKIHRENIKNAQEDISKELPPVLETYKNMPKLSRNAVTAQHSRFLAIVKWLSDYVKLKNDALKLTLEPPINNMVVEMDKMAAGYRPALERYKLQQEQKKRLEEEQRQQDEMRNNIAAIQAFYSDFAKAYEAKNESLIISFLSDDWNSGDGTTLGDLQGYLRDSFSSFDEIHYKATEPLISKSPGGNFVVQYDVVIEGRIFEDNITHDEKSTVTEEVKVDDAGKVRITRTLNGRFWYVQ